MLNRHYLVVYISLLFCLPIHSQVLKAIILDNVTQAPIEGATFIEKKSSTVLYSDAEGRVEFIAPQGIGILDIEILKNGFVGFNIRLDVRDWNYAGQVFYLESNLVLDDLAIIDLEEGDDSGDNLGDIYSMLSSSNNPLQRAVAFQFSALRFRQRGVENTFNQLGINGFNLNDFENDFDPFYVFSGQNILTRRADNHVGPKDNVYDFDAVGINQWIVLNPAAFRKELSCNYSLSNRAYNHRIGLHYASGIGKDNWAFIAGLNRRWAQQGFVPGTFFDSYGAYAGLNKRWGGKHEINGMFIFAPVTRGKNSPGVQEVYDLSADNLYNSYWGYQQGKMRNSRIAITSLPMAFLQWSHTFNPNTTFQCGLMGLKGKRSETRIDFQNANDPRPDYYRKLPSFYPDPSTRQHVSNAWRQLTNVSQIDWDNMYRINRHSYTTVFNANNSDTVSGRRASYWIEERHFNPQELEHYGSLAFANNGHHWLLGYRVEFHQKDFYLTANDLLGADFMVDLEDFVANPLQQNPNINILNHIIRTGDRYGYDHRALHQRYGLWSQYSVKLKKFDIITGAHIARVSNQRESFLQNAIFKNSLGKSNPVVQYTYGAKCVITTKLSGRQYVQLAGLYEKRAHNYEQLFINPAWRPDVLPTGDQPWIFSSELGYYYRSPRFKFQLTGFFIQMRDQVRRKNFFLDGSLEVDDENLDDGGLVNAFYRNLDQQHLGWEGFVSAKLPFGFECSLSGTMGEYIYISRPDFLIYDQFSHSVQQQTIYFKNFYVPGSPQTAVALGLKYNFKRNGFAELSVNYMDDMYIEANPLRRTEANTAFLLREDPLFRKIIDQQKLDAAVIVNAFVFKGFEIAKQHFTLSVGVNNLLNRKDIVSGGFEQMRFDFETKDIDRFPPRYYYLQGINYFISLTYRLN